MKAIGIAVALGCILLGWWTASLPNASQKIPGFTLVGYGATIIILTMLGKEAVVKWLLIGVGVLLVVAYSLPRAFWEFVGLAD